MSLNLMTASGAPRAAGGACRTAEAIGAAGYFPPGVEFFGLPPFARPRLYVMSSPSGWTRWRLTASYPAHRPSARAARTAIRSLHALGLHTRVQRARGPWIIPEFSPGIASRVTYVSVLTSSLEGRFILELHDASGRVVGYLKHAQTEQGKRRLEREYQTLRMLPPGLAPQPLRFGPLGNGLGLLTTPVHGRPMHPVLRPPSFVLQYLSQLTVPNRRQEACDYWPRLEDAGLLECVRALAGTTWPVVIEHGDFAPWNVLQTGPSSVVAIDWEHSETQGFPYLDSAHYLLQTAALVKRLRPAAGLRQAVRMLAGMGGAHLAIRQAAAICRLSAYNAHQRSAADSVAPSDSLQVWRRQLWQGHGD